MNESEVDDRLNAQLRGAFAPPQQQVFEEAARLAVAPRPSRWPWLLAAAALVVAVALAVSRPRRGPEGHDGQQLGAMWAAAYAHAVDNGFAGGSCCDEGLDLRAACEAQFSMALDVAAAGPVKVLGCYCGLPTGGCLAVLARTNGAPVCVYVLPRNHDPRPQLPADSGLDLARREIGGVVLYAVSQAAAAETLTSFVSP